MAVNFELLHSERRFRLNLESIIRKFNRPFHDDDELDLSNFEVVSNNGKLEHIEPRYFGASRLQVTKRRDHSSDSAYGTVSSLSACDGEDEQPPRHDSQYVSRNNQSVDSTLDDDPWMMRYTASEKSANITAIEEIRDAVAKVRENDDTDEPSDADTITDDSSYVSIESEGEEEESDGNDADLDTEDDPKDTVSKQSTSKSRSYDGDIDTDSSARSQAPSSRVGNPKSSPLLHLLFKGRPVSQNKGQPSSACPSGLKALRKDSLGFTGMKLKPAEEQGNSDVSPESDGEEDEEEEIVMLDYDSSRPKVCPLNTTYVVKSGSEPTAHLSVHGSSRDVSLVKCGGVKIMQEPSRKVGRKSVDSRHDTALIKLDNITFNPGFNSTRNDMDSSVAMTSSDKSGRRGLFNPNPASVNSGKNSISPPGRSGTAESKYCSSSVTQSEHQVKNKSVSFDLFMSKCNSSKLDEMVPLSETTDKDPHKTVDFQCVAEPKNSQTAQHLDQHQTSKSESNTSLDYTVLRAPANSVTPLGSPTSSLMTKCCQSKGRGKGGHEMENSADGLGTSKTDVFIKTPDLVKFKKLSINSINDSMSSHVHTSSLDDTGKRSGSHSSETVCTEIQKQFDSLFYQSRPPEEIAALLSPMPIIMARNGNLRNPVHRKEVSPATVLSRLKDVELKSPPRTGNYANKVSCPTELQAKSLCHVLNSPVQSHAELSSGGVHSGATRKLQVQSALPKLITQTIRGLGDVSGISNLPPILSPVKKPSSNNPLEFPKRATSTPRGKHLKNSTFDCGISTIEANEVYSSKVTQIQSNAMECIQDRCLKSYDSTTDKRTEKTKTKRKLDSSALHKDRVSASLPREKLIRSQETRDREEIRRLKKEKTYDDSDSHGFDFKKFANTQFSSESHSMKEQRHKLKEKESPRHKKSTISMAAAYGSDDSPKKTKNITSLRIASGHEISKQKRKEINRIYELDSEESDDMSCRPLSDKGGMTFSDDSDEGGASSHGSPENSFETRVKKLRSRNRESVPARKSLAGAFCVVVSSGGSDYNSGHWTREAAIRVRPSPVSSKRPLSSEDDDSEFSDWNPLSKKLRSVKKKYVAKANNPYGTLACGGPGKCKKFFCFDCSDIS